MDNYRFGPGPRDDVGDVDLLRATWSANRVDLYIILVQRQRRLRSSYFSVRGARLCFEAHPFVVCIKTFWDLRPPGFLKNLRGPISEIYIYEIKGVKYLGLFWTAEETDWVREVRNSSSGQAVAHFASAKSVGTRLWAPSRGSQLVDC